MSRLWTPPSVDRAPDPADVLDMLCVAQDQVSSIEDPMAKELEIYDRLIALHEHLERSLGKFAVVTVSTQNTLIKMTGDKKGWFADSSPKSIEGPVFGLTYLDFPDNDGGFSLCVGAMYSFSTGEPDKKPLLFEQVTTPINAVQSVAFSSNS